MSSDDETYCFLFMVTLFILHFPVLFGFVYLVWGVEDVDSDDADSKLSGLSPQDGVTCFVVAASWSLMVLLFSQSRCFVWLFRCCYGSKPAHYFFVFLMNCYAIYLIVAGLLNQATSHDHAVYTGTGILSAHFLAAYIICYNPRRWEAGWGFGHRPHEHYDDESNDVESQDSGSFRGHHNNDAPSALSERSWIEEAGAIGVLNAMLPTNLPTPWRVPADSSRGVKNELRMVLDTEASDEKLAECPICIEGLCKEKCAVFVRNGKRTCGHYIHLRCAREMNNSGATNACPMCRTSFEEVKEMPQIDNPRRWFATVDAAGDGRLSRREVELALVAQFPLDWAALRSALDDSWSLWDHDGSGYISAEEFVTPGTGMLDYVRKHLLGTTPPPGAVIL
mmetsp:Transcript_17008/g.34079  ORF Transcript_17008/g.34079 Transcript_17008/m.34079 type:complete len:393 (-) Transcript_17008:28-1206(-)